jgi:hypothetical protein
MSQYTFIPSGSETHLDARVVWNGNAIDAESRLTALESGSAGGAVNSVNTQTGTVVLDADDIDDSTTANKFATQGELDKANTALQPTDPTLNSVTTNGATTINDIQVGRIATLHPTNTANDNIASGNSCASIGGTANQAIGNRSTTFGGRSNVVDGADSSSFGGLTQTVRGHESEGFGGTNVTLNTKYTNTVGGAGHVIGLATSAVASSVAKHSITVGGEDSTIEDAIQTAVVGGLGHKIQTGHDRSVVIGGQGIITDAVDTVYVPNINVKDGFKMPTGATANHVLTTDANGVGTWQPKQIITPQVVTSSGGLLTWDHNLGSTIKVNLTEDVTSVSISNAVEGDSGMILVQQGGINPFVFGGSSLRTLSGDLSVIASDMPAASYVCTIGWYYDGSLIYVYVSDTSITSL